MVCCGDGGMGGGVVKATGDGGLGDGVGKATGDGGVGGGVGKAVGGGGFGVTTGVYSTPFIERLCTAQKNHRGGVDDDIVMVTKVPLLV